MMAGWKTEDMLSGISGIMNLAAASGEDLASTSDIVTDALTAFGLTAADSGHFADVLAIASSNANTNVSMMGETFKYAAPMLGAMGYSAEDAAIAIGLMANSGIKASSAGTALRAGLVNLAKPTEAMQTMMDRYGISLTDSSGNMLEFRDLIDELREKLGSLNEVEQAQAVGTIFGKTAMSGWLAVINASAADLEKLTNSVDNCAGATERMAKIRLDNLNGDLTLMDSAFQGLQTTIGEKFTPILRKATQAGTELIGWVDEMIQDNPGLVEGFTAFTVVVGGATAAVTAFNAAMKIKAALSAAALLPTGPIMAGVAAVGLLAAGVTSYFAAINEGVPSVDELASASRSMEEDLDSAKSTFDDTSATIQGTADLAGMYCAKLEELGEDTSATEGHSKEWLMTLQLLEDAMPELSDMIDTQTGAIEGGTEAIRDNIQAWQEKQKAAAYQEYMNQVMSEYNDVAVEVAGNEIKLYDNEQKLAKAQKERAEKQERLSAAEKDFNNGVISYKTYQAMKKDVNDAKLSVEQLQTEHDNLTQALDEGNAVRAEAEATLESMTDAYTALTGATDQTADSTANMNDQATLVDGTIESMNQALSDLAERYGDAYDKAYESISGQYSVWEEAAEIIPTSIGDINAALESQNQYFREANANLENLRGRQADIEGLNTVLTVLAQDGSPQAQAALAGMADASDEDLQQMVNNYLDNMKQQDEWAKNTASIATDIDGSLEDIVNSTRNTVNELDLSDEARAKGVATFSEYISGIQSQYNLLQSEVDRWNKTVSSALTPKFSVPSVPTIGTASAPSVKKPTNTFTKNASGTWQAPEGWSLVGERGPELLYANGYVSGVDAETTDMLQRLLSSEQYQAAMREADAISRQLGGNGTDAIRALSGDSNSPQILGANGPEIVYLQGGERILNAGQTRMVRETMAQREINRIYRELQPIVEQADLGAYASGTASAAPGFAQVGEFGPEMILPPMPEFGSPDVSVNVAQPAVQEVASAAYTPTTTEYHVTVSPTYTINGGNTEEIRRVVERSVVDLRSQIEDVLRDIQEDSVRGAYV